MRLAFTKMQGLGNDFVVLDARAAPLVLEPASFARLADRRYGIGCDQILLIEQPRRADADIRYRVVNADGTAAEQCGNGLRCVARYLDGRDAVRGRRLTVEIGAQTFTVELTPDGARVEMGIPCFTPRLIPLAVNQEANHYTLDFDNASWTFGAVSIGNPHAVFEVPDIEAAPVARLGALLQSHPLFPQRVNAGFMQIVSRTALRLRVYERGAGETLACGTGACAAVAIGRLWGKLDAGVKVELRGGELTVEWPAEGASPLVMNGPATEVFE
ncbi:MAG: diaminopimelate epimerase, partial [Gammaproteobacteria bacterium]